MTTSTTTATDPSITIPIEDGRYFIAVWFVNSGAHDKNWLATVFRNEDGAWEIRYRFRYYRDNKAHRSADRKRCYRAVVPSTTPEARMQEGIDKMAAVIAAEYRGELQMIPLGTDKTDAIIERLAKALFMHIDHAGQG